MAHDLYNRISDVVVGGGGGGGAPGSPPPPGPDRARYLDGQLSNHGRGMRGLKSHR